VDRAFSFPIQLFFERGLLGVLIYTAFFAVVFRTALMNMRRTPLSSLSWAAAAGLAGLLVRDLSYTTLFDDKPVTLGTFVLIGLIALEESKRTTGDRQWLTGTWKLVIVGVVVAVGMIVGVHRMRQAAADSYSVEAAEADSAHDDRGALQHSLRALAILPHPYLQAQAGLFSARSAGITLEDRGRPAEGLRQLATAESFYKSSLEAFPNEASWLHNLGWLLWFRGERNSALQRIRQAIALEPGTAVYRQSLILMLIDQSAFDSTRDELVTLLTLAPEVVDSRWWERIALEQESTVRSALHLAIDTLANRSASDPIRLAREARLYLEAGDLSAAEPLLNESLHELPGMSGAWRNYALILARRGQWDRAAESLERAVFLDPWDGAGYYALSRVVLHIGAEDEQEGRQMRRVSVMFQMKADGVRAASSRSLESMRAYRKFQIAAPVKDDLVVNGLLEFCRPDITREYDKLMQRPILWPR
jgi:tetratricopeptide (TPR) repeat protein